MSQELEEPKAYFMRGKEVCETLGLTPAARDKAIREGLFPRPFRIGVRAKAWKREEIQRLRERNQALEAEVSDLKQGSEAIEERARSELGMIKENEVFIRVTPRVPAPAEAP